MSWLGCALVATLGTAVPMWVEEDGTPSFERDVRPILKAACFHCHGEGTKPKGGLDLRLARLALRGGDSGPAVVPGQLDESTLWERVDGDEMPPGDKKLSAKEKRTLAAWIEAGAATRRPEPADDPPPGPLLTDDDRAFWSFQPIRRPDVPQVAATDRVRQPIDAFLLRKLEEHGRTFAPEADRHALIRRASFDLRGLPPTPEEVAAFVNDPDESAYERLIDRLLASPHFGERWARHWLDVAGYADSDGVSAKDDVRPHAYKYRDYLIRALNADRPWDDLVREQLAGDEMLPQPLANLDGAALDRLLATGFLRMAPDGSADNAADKVQVRNDVVAETIKVVSTSLLGLTVGCAQCHDHRYDPIRQEDYYRFRALFEPALDPAHWRTPKERLVSLWDDARKKLAAEVDAEVKKLEDDRERDLRALVECTLQKELDAAPEEKRDALVAAREAKKGQRTPEQEKLLKEFPRVLVNTGNVSLYDARAHKAVMDFHAPLIAAARVKRPAEDYAHALTEVPGQVPKTHLFTRGDPTQPAQELGPAELAVLAASTSAPTIAHDDDAVSTTGRRLAYARHLTSGQHPLLARVLVNRFWMHLFGRGIVATPGDFGALSERPSHPELLDWLADDFMGQGWSLKALVKRVALSAAYRQSATRDPDLDAIDADNRLLGRMNVRRLDAEAVRDALMAVCGTFHSAMYGPPVPVSVDEASQVIVGVVPRDDAGRQTGKRVDIGADEFRRSVYVQVRRSLPLGLTEVFDAPVPAPNCERRSSSTVAPQALMLMNNDFVVRQALAFAERLEREAGDDPAAHVRRAWALALGGEPNAEQLSSALEFLAAQRADFEAADAALSAEALKKLAPPPASRRALASFGQALLASNAFLYVD